MTTSLTHILYSLRDRSLSHSFSHTPSHTPTGMTETSPVASFGFLRKQFDGCSREKEIELRQTVGVPVTGVEMRIADPETGEEMPRDGESSGEVQARGPWIAGAYYQGPGDAEPKAGDFTDDGWLKTGDVGVLQMDGYVCMRRGWGAYELRALSCSAVSATT